MTDQSTKAVFNATRRQFAVMGVAAAAATGIGAPAMAGERLSAAPTITQRLVGVPCETGVSAGTLFAPEGQSLPGLVMYASPAASRNANLAVARQLAGQGWAVLLIDAPSSLDPRLITRDAEKQAAWLDGQTGVTKAQDGYTLRNFTAAFPKLSLASRAERQRAALTGALFAVPNKLQAKHDSLNEAARALHRLAA
jgi:hypothetical protein